MSPRPFRFGVVAAPVPGHLIPPTIQLQVPAELAHNTVAIRRQLVLPPAITWHPEAFEVRAPFRMRRLLGSLL